MGTQAKRSTIYFEPGLHQALKLKAASSQRSVSELVNEAVKLMMLEDHEDLAAVAQRAEEPLLSYEEMLEDLKIHDKMI